MDLLTGVVQILAMVIAVGGVTKVVSPDAFAQTLRTLRLPGGRGLARVTGVAEIAIGAAAVWLGGSIAALAVAALYAAFAVAVIAARRAGAESCGCFGSVAAPPSTVHVVVNSVSAVLALAAAAVGTLGLPETLADQPLAGVPYLVMLAIGVWLTVTIDTTGAQLVDEMSAVHRLGPTFRENTRAATVPARNLVRPSRRRGRER
jgi:hypothetical protein